MGHSAAVLQSPCVLIPSECCTFHASIEMEGMYRGRGGGRKGLLCDPRTKFKLQEGKGQTRGKTINGIEKTNFKAKHTAETLVRVLGKLTSVH